MGWTVYGLLDSNKAIRYVGQTGRAAPLKVFPSFGRWIWDETKGDWDLPWCKCSQECHTQLPPHWPFYIDGEGVRVAAVPPETEPDELAPSSEFISGLFEAVWKHVEANPDLRDRLRKALAV